MGVPSSIPPVFDYSKIQLWHAQCEATHGDCCNDGHFQELAQQLNHLLLVDVIAGNLVTLPTSTKFVALSYVWGNVATLKSEKSNIEKLKQRGVLFQESYKSAIPNTVRDAIHVVKASGEKFLWVDCLSIIQDSENQDMDRMLQSMARIYASAEFTIVAAQGEDANYGIRGAGGPSEQREYTVSHRDFIHEGGNGFPWRSRWASRGWTFQEALFSRRLLVFNKEALWICGRLMRLEHDNDSIYQDLLWLFLRLCHADARAYCLHLPAYGQPTACSACTMHVHGADILRLCAYTSIQPAIKLSRSCRAVMRFLKCLPDDGGFELASFNNKLNKVNHLRELRTTRFESKLVYKHNFMRGTECKELNPSELRTIWPNHWDSTSDQKLAYGMLLP